MTDTSLAPVESVTAVGQLHAAHIGATLEIDNMIELLVARVLHLEGATYIADTKRPEATEWVRLDPNTICSITSH